MKILACGDLHFRAHAPVNRIDDFFAVQLRKLDFILEQARKNKCDTVVFPGDVFDRANAPYALVETLIRTFKHTLAWVGSSVQTFVFVFGQHDLRYHTSGKANTPLGVLVAGLGDSALVAGAEPIYETTWENAINGASWGEEFPRLPERRGKVKPLLVTVLHKTITQEPLPWEGEIYTAKELLDKYPADVFICGDNHTRFVHEDKGRFVVNLGSVTRMSKDQAKHKPALALIDLNAVSGKVNCKLIPIPIEADVFRDEDERLQDDEKMEKFMQSLGKDYQADLDYKENVRLAGEKCSSGVKRVIDNVLETVG